MIRDLDELAVTFSLWEQARKELAEMEVQLACVVAQRHAHTQSDLHALQERLTCMRTRTDELLAQAIDALRSYAARGNTGA